jgi:hypothetical protein
MVLDGVDEIYDLSSSNIIASSFEVVKMRSYFGRFWILAFSKLMTSVSSLGPPLPPSIRDRACARTSSAHRWLDDFHSVLGARS